MTPQIAPDAMAVPQYAAAADGDLSPIGTYVGRPIRGGDGALFGTLCGMDPVVQTPELLTHAPQLRLLADLLGRVLQGELLQAQAVDREAEVHWRAGQDQLTGLPNRPMFLERVGHALNLQRRDLRPLAVLLFDMDDFKAVNDGPGRTAGDELLVRIAERVRGALRAGDTLARVGGDKFAVLIEDGGDPLRTAHRISEAFSRNFHPGAGATPMSGMSRRRSRARVLGARSAGGQPRPEADRPG